MRATLCFAGLLLAGIATWAGCAGPTVDPKVAAELRGKYLLKEEPAEPSGVLDVKETIKEPQEVVLIGLIGGIDNPWTKGQASFVVADLSTAAIIEDEPAPAADAKSTDAKEPAKTVEHAKHAHHHGGPGHDPATCPFCSRGFDPTKALALVQIVDATGKVLPVDAKEVFQLAKEQTIVVKGRAQQDDSGALVVSATSLFVRR